MLCELILVDLTTIALLCEQLLVPLLAKLLRREVNYPGLTRVEHERQCVVEFVCLRALLFMAVHDLGSLYVVRIEDGQLCGVLLLP